MANPDHIAQLMKGVAAWNAWREANPDIRPQLSGAYLHGVDLSTEAEASEPLTQFLARADLRGADVDVRGGVDLSSADLDGANLSNAKLYMADLGGASLRGANLTEAILCGAKLSGAELINVSLSNARLDGAHLNMANLTQADLTGANLRGAMLWQAGLTLAHLSRADLSKADLFMAHLTGADISGANLWGARLSYVTLLKANLSEANLHEANLDRASLIEADLNEADLRSASLEAASLVNTDLRTADLSGCRVYGASAWDLKLDGTTQQNLIITPESEPEIIVDNIEVAQFVYLLLHNEKLQKVIDTITTKVVMILGRFSLSERKAVLDALRNELRRRNYVPVVFDFEKPRSQTTINTVMLLARMARFVIADVSDAKSVLQELQAIVPSSPKLPVQPIIVATQDEPGMFDSFQPYPWFLKVHCYDAPEQLFLHLDERVIGPAEAMAALLRA